jgi:hypothetical protein
MLNQSCIYMNSGFKRDKLCPLWVRRDPFPVTWIGVPEDSVQWNRNYSRLAVLGSVVGPLILGFTFNSTLLVCIQCKIDQFGVWTLPNLFRIVMITLNRKWRRRPLTPSQNSGKWVRIILNCVDTLIWFDLIRKIQTIFDIIESYITWSNRVNNSISFA